MYVYVNKESGENGEGERGRETLSVLADLFVKVSFERESPRQRQRSFGLATAFP